MTGSRRFAFVACAALAVAAATPAFAVDPMGTWLTEPGTSRIKIANCGGALCGTIVWMKEPIDPETRQARLDKFNADTSKRNRPLMGVSIVIGMKPTGPDKWQGEVYNAEDGKTYKGYITMQGANTLKLEGCALGGFVCKAQSWTRVN